MFWANAQMIMDYAQFGDVVTFDTTYKLKKEHRPFASFVGFNHHRETIIFGATLLYDKTAESFVWLFQNFLEAMPRKAPKTLFTDQDAAMAKAIPIVMPDTSNRLCTWHLMQNALKHVNCLFQDKGVKGVLNKTLMTAFRALASRAAETEETYDFCIAHLTTLGANVERKLSAHFGVGNEVSNDDDTQSFEVDCGDVNHVMQPKGLKKNVATSKGKRRVKGGFEVALVAKSKKKSRANSLASSKSIASPTVSPTVTHSPLSVGGDIYVHQHVPPLQPLCPLYPLLPSLAMGGNSIPPPLMYPTYHAMDKQKQKQIDAEIGLESDVAGMKQTVEQCVFTC
ncbi:hypothetical protein ACSBR2_012424 [Camellia fascicularis]